MSLAFWAAFENDINLLGVVVADGVDFSPLDEDKISPLPLLTPDKPAGTTLFVASSSSLIVTGSSSSSMLSSACSAVDELFSGLNITVFTIWTAGFGFWAAKNKLIKPFKHFCYLVFYYF